jgi:hypothetical protein
MILDRILSNGRLAEEWLNGRDFEGNYLEKNRCSIPEFVGRTTGNHKRKPAQDGP